MSLVSLASQNTQYTGDHFAFKARYKDTCWVTLATGLDARTVLTQGQGLVSSLKKRGLKTAFSRMVSLESGFREVVIQ